jgi:23S rRNA (adenine2030-N6)-methyltransferase
MRPQDRLVACELEPGAAAALAANLRRDARARPIAIDGWTALKAYVPPKERRGVVLIDPPYEAKDEFAYVAAALVAAHRKWATGIFVLWYPITDRAGPDRLAAVLQRSSIRKTLRVELAWPPAANRLAGTGLIIVNPPWRLADDLSLILPPLGAALAPASDPSIRVDWLAREG